MITTLDPPSMVRATTKTTYDAPPELFQPTPWLLFAVGAATATSIILGVAPAATALTNGTSVAPRAIVRTAAALPAESTADTIRRLREESGLTWDQLAKVFGVSRRAVHHWASGENLSASNTALLAEFARIIGAIEAATPAETRQRLLAPGENGESMLDSFRKYAGSAYAEVQPRASTLEAALDPS